jgi:hypothetical protein
MNPLSQVFKDHFRPPTVKELLERELNEARLERRLHQSRVEHAESVVAYNDRRIARIQRELGVEMSPVKSALIVHRAV